MKNKADSFPCDRGASVSKILSPCLYVSVDVLLCLTAARAEEEKPNLSQNSF